MAQMTALRRRMIDDMTVPNLSPATQQGCFRESNPADRRNAEHQIGDFDPLSLGNGSQRQMFGKVLCRRNLAWTSATLSRR